MPRVKRGFKLKRRRKRLLSLAKGFTGPRSKLFRIANETVARALKYSYRDRRTRKRDFRSLWIIRINAAAHNNGINYSQFMHGLQMAQITVDRKILSDMAISDPQGFSELVSIAKRQLRQSASAVAGRRGSDRCRSRVHARTWPCPKSHEPELVTCQAWAPSG